MIKTDLCIIGAGPAGLAAAVEAAKCGVKVTVIDENFKAGGQLFKQIHKFFGSSEHQAGIRGFNIGTNLLSESEKYGVDIRLRTVAYGIFKDKIIGIHDLNKEVLGQIEAKKIIIATGAVENALPFEGWTAPGVMGAGAAQTLMHIYRLRPGYKVVMIGTGNVGLIVSYQLLQSGVNVLALVEAAPKVTGYFVHARKLLRAGVPIYTSSTVKKVEGQGRVESITIVELDEKFQQIPGSEMKLDADTVCIAVGLTPLAELAWMGGCKASYNKTLGGFLPSHDRNMKTSCDDIYVAGDVAGIEEASSAMEEGRVAGISAAQALGYLTDEEALERKVQCWNRLNELRKGPFGQARRTAKEFLFEEGKQKC